MNDNNGSPHGDIDTTGHQERLEITCDLGDLAAPTTPTPILKYSLTDQIPISVELLIVPLVSINVDANAPALDLNRPDSTWSHQEVIDLTPTIGIPTEQEPVVRQRLQGDGHLVFRGNTSRLLGQTMLGLHVCDWCAGS